MVAKGEQIFSHVQQTLLKPFLTPQLYKIRTVLRFPNCWADMISISLLKLKQKLKKYFNLVIQIPGLVNYRSVVGTNNTSTSNQEAAGIVLIIPLHEITYITLEYNKHYFMKQFQSQKLPVEATGDHGFELVYI